MPPKKAQTELWPGDLRAVLSGAEVNDNGIQQSWKTVLESLPRQEAITQVTFDEEGRALPYVFTFIAELLRPYVQLPVEIVSPNSWETPARPRKGTFRIIFRSCGKELKAPSQIFGTDCEKAVRLLKPSRKTAGQREIIDPDTGCVIATLESRHNTLRVHFCEVEYPDEDWDECHRQIFTSVMSRVISLLPEPSLSREEWTRQQITSRREALERVYCAYRVHAQVSHKGDIDELDQLIASLGEADDVVRLQADVERLQSVVSAHASLVEQFRAKTTSEIETLLARSDVVSIRLWGSVLVCTVVKPDSVWTIVVNRAQAGDPVRWFKHEGSERLAYAPSHYRMLIPLVELLSKGAWGTLMSSAIAAIGTSRIQPIHHNYGDVR